MWVSTDWVDGKGILTGYVVRPVCGWPVIPWGACIFTDVVISYHHMEQSELQWGASRSNLVSELKPFVSPFTPA